MLSIIVVVGLVLGGLYFQSSGGVKGVVENKPENRKVKIGYVKVLQALPLIIAQNQGYFKEADIEVEATSFDVPSLFVDAVASNQIDATAYTAATGILSSLEEKSPGRFKVFGGSYADSSYPADFLVTRSDLDINKVSDLKGKKVGVVAGPQFKAMFEQILVTNGLNTNDAVRVELSFADLVPSLKAKSVDAILGVDPAGTIAVSGGFGKRVEVSPISRALGGQFWGGMSVFTTKFINENPALAKDIIKVFDKSIKFINENNQEARKIAAKELAIPEPVALSAGYQNFKNVSSLTSGDKSQINKLLVAFKERGTISKELKIEDLLYNL